MVAEVLVLALVVSDQTPLRAAPRDAAARPAMLSQGDWLEVRGEHLGYLQVYDHRHELPGYVRPAQVRTYPMDESAVPKLTAVIDFLKDTPGSEALGIGYVAATLKAAPASAVGVDLFDALGTMADRLARRASVRQKPGDELAAHLEVAARYGLKFASYEREGRTRVCYDGEAFRRVLALGGTPEQLARAALAVTGPECLNPEAGPVEAQAIDEWRAGVLDRAPTDRLPAYLANRVKLRRASVHASLAYQLARRGEGASSEKASQRAVEELAKVDPTELADEDRAAYPEAAMRVGASRFAAEPALAPAAGLALVATAGQPGETCLTLVDSKKKEQALFERCTYGWVWSASARAGPRGDALVVAVQSLPAWTELWVFHRVGGEWRLDTLAPAVADPAVGYVELAGWSPQGDRLLVVREARVEGANKREFQILDLATLGVQKHADSMDGLSSFRRWSLTDWRERTVALR